MTEIYTEAVEGLPEPDGQDPVYRAIKAIARALLWAGKKLIGKQS
jgi:hypothetical protein